MLRHILILAAVLAASAAGQDAGSGGPGPRDLEPWRKLYDRVRVVAIGIDEYDSPAIRPLHYAEGDAREFADLMETGYGYEVTRLLGAEASKEAIEGAVRTLAGLGKRDVAILYFAGHGQSIQTGPFQRTGYLVPHDAGVSLGGDAPVADYERDAINMRRLGAALKKLEAMHVVFIVDCCFSGFVGSRDPGAGVKISTKLTTPTRQILTAGTHDQRTYESSDLGHGVYSHALLQLLGRRKMMSVRELARFLYRDVRSYLKQARESDPRKKEWFLDPQRRDLLGSSGDFVFVPKSVRDFERGFERLKGRIERLRGERTTRADVFETAAALPYTQSELAFEKQFEWEQRFKTFRDRAVLGDEAALACLYFCYSKGLGVARDARRAYRWAREAFDSGTAAGQYVLASCYRRGEGLPAANLLAARALEKRSAERGFAVGQWRLACEILEQKGVSSAQRDRATELLEKGHAQGFLAATARLGRLLFESHDRSSEQGRRGVRLLAEAAEAGDAGARHQAFRAFAAGAWDGGKDGATARRYLVEAAQAGLAEAQLTLASCLYRRRHGRDGAGHGFAPDPSAARTWAESAARQGLGGAEWLLHLMYFHGDGVEKDFDRARAYLESAVAKNDLEAIVSYARHHWDGTLYRRDDAVGLEYFLRAAERGHAASCHNVAVAYTRRYDLPLAARRWNDDPQQLRAIEKAVRWYRRAVDLGAISPMPNLRGLAHSARQVTGGEPAWRAIREAQLAALSLGSPADQDREGSTRLHWALRLGAHDAVAMLAKSAEALETANEDGKRPIHIAATDPAALKILLEAGAEPNAAGRAGMTALAYACSGGSLACVELLLAHGASVAVVNSAGDTPLHNACIRGHADIARVLLEHGARLDAVNRKGQLPIDIGRRQPDILRLLLARDEGPGNDPRVWARLLIELLPHAARQPDLVALLLAKNLDVSFVGPGGVTPLIAAIRADRPDVATDLLERGAPVSVRDGEGATPLILALSRAQPAVARLLLERGADARAEDEAGHTPLHSLVARRWPARDEQAEIAELLVAAGGDPGKPCAHRDTPLLKSLTSARHLSELLAAGLPKARAGEPEARRALVLACGNQMRRPAASLASLGVRGDEPDHRGSMAIHHAARLGWTDVVEALVANGTPAGAQDRDGNTPLHLASGIGDLRLYQVLLAADAPIDAKNEQGFTPLTYLVKRRAMQRASPGELEIAEALLERGADADARLPSGNTLLHEAARRHLPGLAKLLLDAGAAPAAENREGETPSALLPPKRPGERGPAAEVRALLEAALRKL